MLLGVRIARPCPFVQFEFAFSDEMESGLMINDTNKNPGRGLVRLLLGMSRFPLIAT